MPQTTQSRFTARLEAAAQNCGFELVQDASYANTGSWRLISDESLDSARYVTYHFDRSQVSFRGFETGSSQDKLNLLHDVQRGGMSLDDCFKQVVAFLLGAQTKHNKVHPDLHIDDFIARREWGWRC